MAPLTRRHPGACQMDADLAGVYHIRSLRADSRLRRNILPHSLRSPAQPSARAPPSRLAGLQDPTTSPHHQTHTHHFPSPPRASPAPEEYGLAFGESGHLVDLGSDSRSFSPSGDPRPISPAGPQDSRPSVRTSLRPAIPSQQSPFPQAEEGSLLKALRPPCPQRKRQHHAVTPFATGRRCRSSLPFSLADLPGLPCCPRFARQLSRLQLAERSLPALPWSRLVALPALNGPCPRLAARADFDPARAGCEVWEPVGSPQRYAVAPRRASPARSLRSRASFNKDSQRSSFCPPRSLFAFLHRPTFHPTPIFLPSPNFTATSSFSWCGPLHSSKA